MALLLLCVYYEIQPWEVWRKFSLVEQLLMNYLKYEKIKKISAKKTNKIVDIVHFCEISKLKQHLAVWQVCTSVC